MTATDVWFTSSVDAATSPGIPLDGCKLGIRWDASSVEGRYRPHPANAYEIRVWGSVDGKARNRLVELLAVGPQELNERTADTAFFFYQGSLSGLTVPYRYAIVEFTNKTGAALGSNMLVAWVADAEPLDVKVPVQGFWGTLDAHATPEVDQVRDYARVVRYLDVTVFIDQPGVLEFYEQSWDKMRLVSTHPVAAERQTVVRIQRGGFPRFSLLLRNDSGERANCEIVAIARHE